MTFGLIFYHYLKVLSTSIITTMTNHPEMTTKPPTYNSSSPSKNSPKRTTTLRIKSLKRLSGSTVVHLNTAQRNTPIWDEQSLVTSTSEMATSGTLF